MTINEAMICLSIQSEVKHRLGKDFEATALQLGIEALKCIIRSRDVYSRSSIYKLPSETKE